MSLFGATSETRFSNIYDNSGSSGAAADTYLNLKATDISAITLAENQALSHFRSPAQSAKQRRTVTRRAYPIDDCTQGAFLASYCSEPEEDRDRDRIWSMLCMSNSAIAFEQGACANDEICETAGEHHLDSEIPIPVAWCLPLISLATIRNRELGKAIKVRQTDVQINDGAGARAIVKAAGGVIDMGSLSLMAQSTSSLFDAVTYTTLDRGMNACTNCSSIGLKSLPVGTQAIEVDVVLPNDALSANVYLASYGL
ncbi:hypothetical protein MMC20_002826 [Loxospora ochrophaea]|nr:hypothetical protein [Loxospora ochrophaea]